MEKKGSLTSRILVIVIGSILLITVWQLGQIFLDSRGQFAADRLELEQQVRSTFEANVRQELENLSLLSGMVAQTPEVQSEFARGDREALKARFLDFFNEISEAYGISQFQFHTPESASFFRVHSPDKFGDDLSTFRKTVVASNHGKSPVIGLEVGKFGPGARAVYPVSYQGKHQGTVEFGGAINGIFENLKSVYGVEYAVGIRKEVFAAAGRAESDEDIVQGGIIYYQCSCDDLAESIRTSDLTRDQAEIGGNQVNLFRVPLEDYTGSPVGHVLVMKNIEGDIRAMQRTLYAGLGSNGIILLVSALILFFVISRSLRPVKIAAEAAQRIALGNFHVDIQDTRRRDETGLLLHSMREMSESLKEQIGTIESIAVGDLTMDVVCSSDQDQLGSALQEMKRSLYEMIQKIHETSANIAESSGQVAKAGGGSYLRCQ